MRWRPRILFVITALLGIVAVWTVAKAPRPSAGGKFTPGPPALAASEIPLCTLTPDEHRKWRLTHDHTWSCKECGDGLNLPQHSVTLGDAVGTAVCCRRADQTAVIENGVVRCKKR